LITLWNIFIFGNTVEIHSQKSSEIKRTIFTPRWIGINIPIIDSLCENTGSGEKKKNENDEFFHRDGFILWKYYSIGVCDCVISVFVVSPNWRGVSKTQNG